MKNYQEIDGWFNYENVFDFLVSEVPDGGTFVECGSWLGKSSSYLCDIAKDRINVFIIDSWKGSINELSGSHSLATKCDIYEIFLNNMGTRNFTPVRANGIDASIRFADDTCDVVFIDMEHTYDAVSQDISAWFPKVKSGGYIAGHDYVSDWPGVIKAVNENFDKNDIQIINSCWIVRKR